MHQFNSNLSKKILSWYDNNKRSLPWRIDQKSEKNQYYRIISEFMLQQTQVKTVIPYFKSFIKEIPNLRYLAKSKKNKVLKLWEGLGYYRRATNLHETAKILIKNYNGKLPKKFEEVIKLPGIGKYSASALLAFVYNEKYIAIDGNVKRLISRLFSINIKSKSFNSRFEKLKKYFYHTSRNSDMAEGLIEFGATICKPKKPFCHLCNLKENCKFYNKVSKISYVTNKIKIEKNYNIYCYLKKNKKAIALTRNKKLTFLNNFKMPLIKNEKFKKNIQKNGWKHLCKYKNNISNIKMNINLFYKFTKSKPKKFKWYFIDKSSRELIPSFTKKIFQKVEQLYL